MFFAHLEDGHQTEGRNAVFFDATAARQGEDAAPTRSTGDAAFGPGTSLPEETPRREVVVV